jgi:exosortase C (VPDSG-CTERM-specific)
MKIVAAGDRDPEPGPGTPKLGSAGGCWRFVNHASRMRWCGGLLFLIVLLAAFCRPLFSLFVYAAGSELDSYILLVPFISGYLLFLQRERWPRPAFSPVWAIGPAALALAALLWTWHLRAVPGSVSPNDFLALMALAFLSLLVAGGFLFLGRKWLAASAFPVAFLIFMIPLPDAAVVALETASRLASADAADLFFNLTGTPFLRDGVAFQLPGISIYVAQECSGIHSSFVLFITSLLISHLLLQTAWRRAVLIALVIPLGVLRNGFRILVIAWLCIHVSPRMINSPIHHQGGPLFFILSLIPLFLLLWALKRSERKKLAA